MAVRSAPALVISGGAEQPFSQAMEGSVSRPSGRDKVVHNQQSIFGNREIAPAWAKCSAKLVAETSRSEIRVKMLSSHNS